MFFVIIKIINYIYTIENKTDLFSKILISNENIETYSNIYEYLINKYKSYPTKMNVDCQKAHIIALLKLFRNCVIIICYLLIIRRLFIHLHELRAKNNKKKINRKIC